MPGYDQDIPIPQGYDLPIMDSDEILPNLLHPSYPFGRPTYKKRGLVKGVGNLLNRLEPSLGNNAWGGKGGDAKLWNERRNGEEGWNELGLDGVMEGGERKEVPPGMAVS